MSKKEAEAVSIFGASTEAQTLGTEVRCKKPIGCKTQIAVVIIFILVPILVLAIWVSLTSHPSRLLF